MEGIKFIASQAKSIHHYKSLRSKILKCNANIFFNKQCLAKSRTTKYVNINAPATSNLPKIQKKNPLSGSKMVLLNFIEDIL